MPQRSLFYKGRQFPVCARCTGVFIGYYFGFLAYSMIEPPIIVCILFCLIMFIDWFIQYLNIKSSNNIRRLITGFLCGYGFMHICIKIFFLLIIYILKE